MSLKEIKRRYKGADCFMVQEARIIHNLVNTDLDRFTAFDSTITAVSQTAFLDVIVAAETVVDDTAIVGQMKHATEQLLDAMEVAKSKYAEVKYHATKAFPNSPGTQHEFGTNDYDEVRKSVTKMVPFLEELSNTAIKYQSQLIEVGYSASAIEDIAAVLENLRLKSSAQKMIMKQRPKQTDDRVIALNDCHARMALINAAAQRVYATDYAKQRQFIYMPGAKDGLNTKTFSGSVPEAETVLVAEIKYDTRKVFTFTNTGAAALLFCVSTSNEVHSATVKVEAGATEVRMASELNPGGTKLFVKNLEYRIKGDYTVDIET